MHNGMTFARVQGQGQVTGTRKH